jgi:hypothetical protein
MHSWCSQHMNRALALRVDSLADLAEGWFDEANEPYSAAALQWLGSILDHLIGGFKVPIPYVYPTAGGRVRAGWATPSWDVLADIDLSTHAVDLFACKVATHEVHERQLVLESPSAEDKLGKFVASHTV